MHALSSKLRRPGRKKGEKTGCNPGKSVERKEEGETAHLIRQKSVIFDTFSPRRRLWWGGVFPKNTMKREFLLGLQEENPLSKQTIDAIMAENGKDIQATRALFADYESLKEELAAARQTITQLEETSSKALEEKVRQMEFHFNLKQAVLRLGGRNQKAVEALLDIESLQQAEDSKSATEEALCALQKENPWLFQTQTPPPYAPGTGVQRPNTTEPDTLAGALREKFDLRAR